MATATAPRDSERRSLLAPGDREQEDPCCGHQLQQSPGAPQPDDDQSSQPPVYRRTELAAHRVSVRRAKLHASDLQSLAHMSARRARVTPAPSTTRCWLAVSPAPQSAVSLPGQCDTVGLAGSVLRLAPVGSQTSVVRRPVGNYVGESGGFTVFGGSAKEENGAAGAMSLATYEASYESHPSAPDPPVQRSRNP
jgi:hypothetical protein